MRRTLGAALALLLATPAGAGSFAVSDLGLFDSRQECVTRARETFEALDAALGTGVQTVERFVIYQHDIGGGGASDALISCVDEKEGARAFLAVFSAREGAPALRDEIRALFGPADFAKD